MLKIAYYPFNFVMFDNNKNIYLYLFVKKCLKSLVPNLPLPISYTLLSLFIFEFNEK